MGNGTASRSGHRGGGTERQTAVGICVRYGPEHPARAWWTGTDCNRRWKLCQPDIRTEKTYTVTISYRCSGIYGIGILCKSKRADSTAGYGNSGGGSNAPSARRDAHSGYVHRFGLHFTEPVILFQWLYRHRSGYFGSGAGGCRTECGENQRQKESGRGKGISRQFSAGRFVRCAEAERWTGRRSG